MIVRSLIHVEDLLKSLEYACNWKWRMDLELKRENMTSSTQQLQQQN